MTALRWIPTWKIPVHGDPHWVLWQGDQWRTLYPRMHVISPTRLSWPSLDVIGEDYLIFPTLPPNAKTTVTVEAPCPIGQDAAFEFFGHVEHAATIRRWVIERPTGASLQDITVALDLLLEALPNWWCDLDLDSFGEPFAVYLLHRYPKLGVVTDVTRPIVTVTEIARALKRALEEADWSGRPPFPWPEARQHHPRPQEKRPYRMLPLAGRGD
ncbi:hypothetical protein TPY_0709 [Sulfobacillus acidophilus TPY]|uniref:Uncharacterized protein n=1 Tax=Sulfobacillus acidophilus (strain ATCC 700253 / DSM 10332 / NAL) TaxID=679936 RepID=G8TZR1_SULAD|nr:hypothetical protein TPY_0709 [Sulfobacillus acidophilus TPY]AEW06391.1 hypothetical protein Sulac_2930 [Sulfobacillus acidophilus DSM 10332]